MSAREQPSDNLPTKCSEPRVIEPLTRREIRYIAERVAGKSKTEAGLACGFSPWVARNAGQSIETQQMRDEIERLKIELTEYALDKVLIDASEIHEYLTEAIRADMRDIQNEDGSFKPRSEWPSIWGRMQEAGDVEVMTEYERSDDGATNDKRGGWDASGTVTKVKLKFLSRVKLLELAMKHKGVNAMVDQKGPELHLHLHEAITQRLQGALKRQARLVEGKVEEGE